MKLLTQAALAAKAIKKELKLAFPNAKFSVRSENYAGGDSVCISWEDNPVSISEVDKIVRKYQYGHFNGMEDIYEYSNSREDIPQVRFVQTNFNWSQKKREELTKIICQKFDIYSDAECMKKMGCYLDQLIWSQSQKMAINEAKQ